MLTPKELADLDQMNKFMAEQVWTYYSELLIQGFGKAQAMRLTEAMQTSFILSDIRQAGDNLQDPDTNPDTNTEGGN